MNTTLHIRKNIFGVTQMDFAKIAGVSQAAISFWENDEVGAEPSLSDLKAMRAAALARGLAWDDGLLFAQPDDLARPCAGEAGAVDGGGGAKQKQKKRGRDKRSEGARETREARDKQEKEMSDETK